MANSIQQNLEQVTSQIAIAAQKCGRPRSLIKLLAVSKTQPVAAIVQAVHAGQMAFGENYVQEGIEKVQYFAQHHPQWDLEWHFIGPLQSNKTRLIAEHFDWMHTLSRAKVAQRLNDQRPQHLPPLQVLIQVNTSGEASKSGIEPEDVLPLAQFVSTLPHLTLRGLMSIPKPETDYSRQLMAFNALADLQKELQKKGYNLDTLSMGMSQDMTAAIEAGSTLVRVGTAIFGQRPS